MKVCYEDEYINHSYTSMIIGCRESQENQDTQEEMASQDVPLVQAQVYKI